MVVEVKNLFKHYGKVQALDGLDLQLSEGEVLGLLGPNGSGKTTAINCMLSLLSWDKGSVSVFDRPMTPNRYDAKARIGVVPQHVAIFEELTVRENVDYFCGLYVQDIKRRKDLVSEAIGFVGLAEWEKTRPKQLSGGMLRRLNIACGIAHKPDLIFMDEPTVAVDPQSRNSILEGIRELNRQGATIVYTSHYMEEVETICSRIVIMDKGRVIAQGSKDALKSLIDLGEKNSFEVSALDPTTLRGLEELPGVAAVNLAGDTLKVSSHRGSYTLEPVLRFLRSRDIAFGKVYSEQPTLNDVFLEITGKELRD